MSDERIHSVRTTGSWLRVRLTDGRECVVPLKWYPRLYGATDAQRGNYRLIGGGSGICWPELDEDLSLAGILRGEPAASESGA